MTNHDHHDMARLAELAASDPEGAEARAMVDECAECAEELHLQIEAISLLGELPPAELTEAERSHVRQGVWESLQPEVETPSPVTEPTPIQPSRPWYTRLAGAAAALVVLAGLGYFLVDNPLLGGGGDSAMVSDQEVATTAADGAEEETADTVAEAAPETVESAEGRDEDGSEAEDATETTMAAAETTAAEAPAETLSTPDAASVSEVLDPVVAEAVDRVVDRLRDTAQDRTPQSARSLDLSPPETRCLESLDLDEVLAVDSITARERRLMVVSHKVDETVEVEVYDLADCTQVTTSDSG